MGDIVPCLITRLQEKQQSFFFSQRRGMQNAGGRDFPLGEKSCDIVYGALRGSRRGWPMNHQQLWGSVISESQRLHGKAGYF